MAVFKALFLKMLVKFGTTLLIEVGEVALDTLRKRTDNPVDAGDVARIRRVRNEHLAMKKGEAVDANY